MPSCCQVLPASARDGAILDDGTGFAAGREQGLEYGWSCDGDPAVDYSGGIRGDTKTRVTVSLTNAAGVVDLTDITL
jgi:hypothetical protein